MQHEAECKDVAINLVKSLISKGLTISVAESITAGNLQTNISSVSGASNTFLGGMTAYGIHSKVNILHVNNDLAVATNCVSAQVADQMAIGAIGLFGSDISLATCGYAEMYDVEGITEPYAHISIAIKQRHGSEITISRYKVFPKGSRVEVQNAVANIAMNSLLMLLNNDG